MKLFSWKKKKEFFTTEEQARILKAIQDAETKTSGEVRLFIESRCKYVDAVDRAAELFLSMKMQETTDRNASLIYVAVEDHQAAIVGDKGIHEMVGKEYWHQEIARMMNHFRENHLADGICQVIGDIGEVLHNHFPYDRDTDKNELPDDIVFGN